MGIKPIRGLELLYLCRDVVKMQLITIVYECAYCNKIIKTEFQQVHTIEEADGERLKNVPDICKKCKRKVLNKWDTQLLS